MLAKSSKGMMYMSNDKVEKADDSSSAKTTKSNKCKHTRGDSSAKASKAMTSDTKAGKTSGSDDFLG